MSTRSVIKVTSDGHLKVCQFVQSDGYPTWRGKEVLMFVRNILIGNKEPEFRQKINASTSEVTPKPDLPRFDFAFVGENYKPSNRTFTGAPITPTLINMLGMIQEERADSTKGVVSSWYDAFERLFLSDDISAKEADQIVVASRDSGVGCLRWLMGRNAGIAFYMPEDLVGIPDCGGLSPVGDGICGVYVIDLDSRVVSCGFSGFVRKYGFDDIISMSDELIDAEMNELESAGT